MKKKVVILVDGENISAKHAERIIALGEGLGRVAERRVYHLQNDLVTRRWTEAARGGAFKDIQLYGAPAKDKVDRKIQKDARAYLRRPDVDMVCVVTSDGGFRCLAEEAAAIGKRLCFIGGKQASRRLRFGDARFMSLM